MDMCKLPKSTRRTKLPRTSRKSTGGIPLLPFRTSFHPLPVGARRHRPENTLPCPRPSQQPYLSSSARACTSHPVSMIPSAASLPWREIRRRTALAVSSPSITIHASVSSTPTTISPTVAEPPVIPSLKRSACAQIFLS